MPPKVDYAVMRALIPTAYRYLYWAVLAVFAANTLATYVAAYSAMSLNAYSFTEIAVRFYDEYGVPAVVPTIEAWSREPGLARLTNAVSYALVSCSILVALLLVVSCFYFFLFSWRHYGFIMRQSYAYTHAMAKLRYIGLFGFAAVLLFVLYANDLGMHTSRFVFSRTAPEHLLDLIFIINLTFFGLGLMVPGLCLFLVGIARRLLKLDE